MVYLEDLLALGPSIGAKVVGHVFARTFLRLSHDSRKLQPGEMFVAVVSERGDGHDYILEAVRQGASGVLCERPPAEGIAGVTVVQVSDVREALTQWMSRQLARYNPTVIAVTGSIGKTTTAKLLSACLGAAGFPTFENDNRNDLFGLPIALSELSAEHQYAVLEMACVERGEFPRIVEIARPKTVVVTGFGVARLENFGTPEAVSDEVGRSLQTKRPSVVAFNGDDPLATSAAADSGSRLLSFGLSEACDLRATDVEFSESSTRFSVAWGEWNASVQTRLLGIPAVYGGLAALAVIASEVPEALDLAVDILGEFEPLPGRLRRLSGVGGCTIVDDSFNSSLPSMEALFHYAEIIPDRKIFVLGDTQGLGEYRDRYFEAVVRGVAHLAERCIVVGQQAEGLLRTARRLKVSTDKIHIAPKVEDVPSLVGQLGPGDTVLVKGSEAARMERVSALFLGSEGDPRRVLARQDPGWVSTVTYQRDRPTWLEIDLSAIAGNLSRIREIVGPKVDIMAVLKADAYGHGAVQVARTVGLQGAQMLAVATVNEGVVLRDQGIGLPILVLGYVPPWQVREAIARDLAIVLYSEWVARYADRWARAMGRKARVHIKVDTGMTRLGVLPEDLLNFLEVVFNLAGVEVEGIFTHFANADVPEHPMNVAQLDAFRRVLRGLMDKGWVPDRVHAANSAATLYLEQSRFNMVRPGIALFGLQPSPRCPLPDGFRPAVSFKSQVGQVKRVAKGTCVSYGCKFVTSRESLIAVLPVGYGDGFRRGPSSWKEVLVRGRRAPVVGTVCMDMCMVDVTDIPGVREGDEVVLIGRQGEECISVEEVAGWLGTVNYEVVCQILARVPRVVV